MQRVDAPEILDSPECPPEEIADALKTLDRINRWFGGVATTRKMVERVCSATGMKNLSMLEVAAGSGKVPELVAQRLARDSIELTITVLDRLPSHLSTGDRHGDGHFTTQRSACRDGRPCRVAGDALALPFPDQTFDIVSCNLFAHHLNPQELVCFMEEGLRVCRRAVLINDLVRHPMHLALAYAGYPIMGSRVAWLDGLTSVRRAYVPEEIRNMAWARCPQAQIEIVRNYLFRMGIVLWRNSFGIAGTE